ncbi:alanyl-tRNA synthetase [Anseongella ginsenosidimutans]|uniref:Alanine--tRNA ligase n=1 Tax=Anseongella ginsenosidimutans TaxID=496056 RepID=A0A4R3KRH4_9SPHI|nr:alanine--tRNA ligase [Anseongella ginsenosidimutans]QEC52936.1 alanine--tRNA ligase [Anseongella ginsenosidimutans]TCS87331.1 alanyl-tRNA synthetase [Anseongella ginsenosidimutans]
MTSNEIRSAFLDFFAAKGHEIVPSAPLVIKNDPTLMFTNAGMNQFKDIFLGVRSPEWPRVADTQKCLRVSGKHNDLEEVGYDTYHHTMFEMLGNWSFGDYFKKEAVSWSWELLTRVYGLPEDRLYVTIFEGDAGESLVKDEEALECWKQHIAPGRILEGSKKDNFWEMGDTGPCGPCSEIHIDLRPDAERALLEGKELVNRDHPLVVEIWNNVFIQYNRKADGNLEALPTKHVDTGMGFERLCMALQGKTSSYDTDVFQPLIRYIADRSGKEYGKDKMESVAMRVMADHIRAIAFAITDGQLPANTGAGYVIRRILRRALRYGFTFLGFKEPFLYQLTDVLAGQFNGVFSELTEQKEFVKKVIQEEEAAFLRTLAGGIQRFEKYAEELQATSAEAGQTAGEQAAGGKVEGAFAFELYDTYGFPVDLTQLLAREKGLEVDMEAYREALEKQKARSRTATAVDTGDWVELLPGIETAFVGYDKLECEARIVKYRKITTKGKEQYQLVLDQTPFYGESGGQVGDTGVLSNESGSVPIIDTKKENNLIVHFSETLPAQPEAGFRAIVDQAKRRDTAANHTATHLLHAVLKEVLGAHVQQKGSLVNPEYLRFDFSHFSRLTEEELAAVERLVNERIRENIPLEERRFVPYQDALEEGVTALFGEKYGDLVRVITFDPDFSRELCGGTHVAATGQIGFLKITSESAVAAGVRRIEAITAEKAETYVNTQLAVLKQGRDLLKNPSDLLKSLQALLQENQQLKKEKEQAVLQQAAGIKDELLAGMEELNGARLIARQVQIPSAEAIKSLAFELRSAVDNLFLVLGAELDGKAHLTVMISDALVKEKGLNAGAIVRELGKEIRGGGGGQAFYATAGGKDPGGLQKALDKARQFILP